MAVLETNIFIYKQIVMAAIVISVFLEARITCGLDAKVISSVLKLPCTEPGTL